MRDSDDNVIYTVGHSNHSVETFLNIVKRNNIEVIADVRSSPYSRYAAQFNKDALQKALVDQGLKYVFLGDLLGGRPENGAFYDAGNHVLYKKLAESEQFKSGIFRLEEGMRRYRVALLCGEEDPAQCHRRLLVGRVLQERGVEVRHIRGDGRVQTEEELINDATGGQGELFAVEEVQVWQSTQSVSPKKQPPNSSKP